MSLQPKKSLGQNFLTHAPSIKVVVTASGVHAGSRVVEIGPGKGALTGPLLETGAFVIAIETDERMVEHITQEYPEKNLHVLHMDALEWVPDFAEPYCVVANIPFYITGLLLRHFLSLKHLPESMTLITQKEITDRIVANDKKHSLLSLSIQVYGTPKRVRNLPAHYFTPKPKVDASIIHIRDISRARFKNEHHEKEFFKLIHIAFAHKRKQLQKNLRGTEYESLVHELTKNGYTENVRAEDVSLNDWVTWSSNF